MPIRQAPGKNKIIVIVGPTASGKSALGVYLAQKLNGEIISADSRQVYRGLDIGTGKVHKREMRGIPHHLLDVANPKKQFSVSDFKKLAEQKLIMIYHNKKIPVVVGGTGLYVDALLGRVAFPNVPPNKKLRAQLERHTTEKLFARVQKLDPARAKTIEPKHKRRLIRALEIATYKHHSPVSRSEASEVGYDVLWLGLNPGEQKLKKNIRTRLKARVRAGMVAEAQNLHAKGLSYKRMEELGLEYRFLARYLRKQPRRKVGVPTKASGNKLTKAELLEQLERAINKYAKRQMRWFKRNKDIVWIKTSTDALRLSRRFVG